jgi:hypothetical protein
MRLYAAVVTEPTDKPDTKALNGLDKALAKMTALKAAVGAAWIEISALAAKDKVTDYQALFLAPEYYFSNQRHAEDRFFGQDTKRWIVANLAALAKLYPKLLIIPGTVLWTKDATPERAKKALARMDGAQKFGTTVDQTGWSHNVNGEVARALKLHDAMLAQNVAFIALGDKVIKYHKVGNYKEVDGEKGGTLVFEPGSIVGRFSVGGVKYGLEICMDHALGVFDQSVKDDGAVHVRLIVSSTVKATDSKHAAVTIHSSSDKQAHLAVYAPPGKDGEAYFLDGIDALKKRLPKNQHKYIKVESRGLNPIRFPKGDGTRKGDPPARLAAPPVKRTTFTIWPIELDEKQLKITSATDYTLKDTELKSVGNLHEELINRTLIRRGRHRRLPAWLGG